MYHATLITAQFLLSALLVLSARWSPIPRAALLLASPGIALAVSSWYTMGIRRLRIHPSTTQQTKLLQHGPYAFVRHPMYTGLLWFTAALLADPWQWWRALTWIALLVVLIAKTREEEAAMMQQFAEYGNYRDRVGGLLPKLRRPSGEDTTS